MKEAHPEMVAPPKQHGSFTAVKRNEISEALFHYLLSTYVLV